ncbi:MAG: hypothetical protein KZQ70_12690 [gamma proteobacterium symbiont of Lucinoma myriamae]|nr:hypothetical protein [gamma proteobacterium symbiont of Lucinoma myriamae]MCU7819572.1 hypothetical protein [gamma proteobacterium symbiont of Lucinoma myriamae]
MIPVMDYITCQPSSISVNGLSQVVAEGIKEEDELYFQSYVYIVRYHGKNDEQQL